MEMKEEDVHRKKLMFTCRICQKDVEADHPLIYRNRILHTEGEMSQIIEDVTADPTLPRTKDVSCPVCGERNAVFFQASNQKGDEQMTLCFVCIECGKRWKDE